MAGLFMSPQDVLLAEAAARQQAGAQQGGPQSVLQGSLFNLGNVGGDALQRGLGQSTVTPMQRRAAELQRLAKRIDFADPKSIMAGVNDLNKAGFQEEAMKIYEMLPSGAQKPVVIDEWYEDIKVGDTTKRVMLQRKSDGSVNQVAGVQDTASETDPLKGFNLGQEWERDVKFGDFSSETTMNRLINLPDFKGFGPMADTDDPEAMKPLLGLIQRVANDLKDNHRAGINRAVFNGEISRAEAEASIAPNDDLYLNEAYKRFVAGGGVYENIDKGFNMAGADIKLDPLKDTADSGTLERRVAANDKRAKALADVATRAGKLVVGDPKNKQFRLDGLQPEQITSVFSRLDQKEDGAIRTQLENMGFQFTPELYESHAVRWQWMREMPQVTAKFINLAGSQDLFDAERARLLDQLEDAENFPAFAKAAEILKYIDRIKPVKAKPKGGRPFRGRN